MSPEKNQPDDTTDDTPTDLPITVEEAIQYLHIVLQSFDRVEERQATRLYQQAVKLVQPKLKDYRNYLLELQTLPFQDFVKEFMSQRHINAIVVVFGVLSSEIIKSYLKQAQKQREQIDRSIENDGVSFLSVLLEMDSSLMDNLLNNPSLINLLELD